MFLTKLIVQNFLGVTDVELDLGDFTALYGPNGAGKTSLADAIFHLCTGDVIRHDVLGAMVRQGAKSAVVEGEFGSRGALRREVMPKGRELYIDGVLTAAKDAAVPVRELLGASPAALRAALRSGAILELPPTELQQLLMDLTGARVDRAAIAEALGESTRKALARLKLEIPETLGQLETTATKAVQARPAAKSKRKTAQDDLDASIILDQSVEEAATKTTAEAASKRVIELQRKRDDALRSQAGADGARTERRREVIARIAELERVPAPGTAPADPAPLRTALDQVQVAVVRAQEALATLDRESIRLRREIGEAIPSAPPLAQAKATLQSATTASAEAEAALKALKTEGQALAAQVERLRSGGGETCPHCTQAIPAELIAALESRLAALRAKHVGLSDAADAAAAALERANLDAVNAERAAARATAQARIDAIVVERKQVGVVFDTATATEQEKRKAYDAAVAKAREHESAKRTHDAAKAEIERLRIELAGLDTPAPVAAVSLPELDAEIARAIQVRDTVPVIEKRARWTQWVAEAEQEIDDRNAVEKRCLEVKADLLARAVGPFTDAANAALTEIAPGVRIEVVSADGFEIVAHTGAATVRVPALSDGQRTRVLYALQLAAARLARVPLLLLDRAELVDDAGRAAIVQLAGACADEGIQVVLFSCKPAPEAVDAGFTAYAIEAGRSRRIPARHAEAA
jgi:DNA repair exonuclease SbcCD ATPase subunit